MYALLSGHLRIHLDLDPDAITVLEPGEIVGELSVIDGQATSTHVVAEGECRVLGIDENTAWGLSCVHRTTSPTISLRFWHNGCGGGQRDFECPGVAA